MMCKEKEIITGFAILNFEEVVSPLPFVMAVFM